MKDKHLVAVTDFTFPDLAIERGILEPVGCEVIEGQCRTEEELISLTAEADHVIAQFAPVTARVIESMTRARLIVRYGIGVDNVDLEAARRRGVPVCNVPTFCIDEVADHTLAAILGLTRWVLPNHRCIERGEWKLAVPLNSMRTLKHLTVGVVGMGRIGRAVARRLRAFGCRLLIYDPVVGEDVIREEGAEPVDFGKMLGEADLITLHCPSTERTRGLVNREALARMKRGALLVNFSRGDVVVSDDLVEALRGGRLAGAALDVFRPEPIPQDSPLRTMENVILSAHISSASQQAVTTLRRDAAEAVACRVRGEIPPNIVNGVTLS